LDKAVHDFIDQHQFKSASETALILSKQSHLPKSFILNQINGRQKAKKKFPSLLVVKSFIFPSSKAISQSSSEKTALYKSKIVSADSIADLSGGMGLDSYYFSKKAKHVDYVELDKELFEISSSNFESLNAENISTHNYRSEQFIKQVKNRYDLVFIDPDRRVTKDKAFRINDCEPNVASLLPLIWKCALKCLIKLSPMLDITQALNELKFCKEVHVVSVDNDCKEILFLLEKDFNGPPRIKTINIKKEQIEHFDFNQQAESETLVQFGEPQQFLYEPNASILKAGAFKSIAASFELKKLAKNTHLYSSDKLIENFPGRTLKVISTAKPKKGMVHQANVVTRNFHLSPDQIKRKYKIKDGGSSFIYACRLEDNSQKFIHCELII